MAGTPPPLARLFRFGPFKLDVRAGELRNHGIRIKLREQPVQILLMLLEHPGEVILREEIRLRLWPNNTVVEFDHGINAAIQKLRDGLGESADRPRYVETVARRGYRFLGDVERVGEPQLQPAGDAPPVNPVAAGTVDPDDLTGRTFSHYRIVGKLGEGGMGVVYRAEDLKLGRPVALKFLPGADGESPESILRRFEREARAVAALNHPHICTVYGLEDFGGQPAIVMEFVEGETLAARLAKGALPLDQSLALATQIAGALAEAHGRGIVHRDLKPANIMLTGPRGHPGAKVLDFGLARRLNLTEDETRLLTLEGEIVGTPAYMSPEQAQGKPLDAASDIFAFGAVLYEMLTGHRAFPGDTTAATISAILRDEPAPLRDSIEGLPPELERMIGLCLRKDPGRRLQHIQDVAILLQALKEESGVAQARPASVAPREPAATNLPSLPTAPESPSVSRARAAASTWCRPLAALPGRSRPWGAGRAFLPTASGSLTGPAPAVPP